MILHLSNPLPIAYVTAITVRIRLWLGTLTLTLIGQ